MTTAAPDEIVGDATIVRIESNGEARTLKKGNSEFTCFIANNVPMCADPNAMEWAKAWQTHAPPPEKVGFIYMLHGDNGASNTDPWATKPGSDNHWIKTGAHVMMSARLQEQWPDIPGQKIPTLQSRMSCGLEALTNT